MELIKCTYPIKCESVGCNNLATHILKTKRIFNSGIKICDDCLKDLKSNFTEKAPKSPKNILNTKIKE